MTDAPFVLAAYAVVAGGLGLYGLALRRRRASARRVAAAVARRARGPADASSTTLARADRPS